MTLAQAKCVCGRLFFTATKQRVCSECKTRTQNGARHRREIREFYAEGSHTEEEWQERIEEQKRCCFWCDRYLFDLRGRFIGTKDHLTPLSRHGSDAIENIVAACRPCNSKKGARTEAEYLALISESSTEPTSSSEDFDSTNSQPADLISRELISAVDVCFPGFRKLIQEKRMDKGWQMSREEEMERRRVLHQQAIYLQRLQREAAGQLTLPIFGEGQAKKLAQSEIASLPFKGMNLGRKA